MAGNPDEEDLLNDPLRSFFMLKNSFGPFKSSYSEALLQYVMMINQLKNGGKYSVEDLDIFAKHAPRCTQNVVYKESMADLGITSDPYISTEGVYGDDSWIYGAYSALKKGVNAKEWLKFMSCLTKEPAYSSYTNIRACVDYIFYDDGERGDQERVTQPKLIDLVRVLDMPSYSMFMKGNVQALPHPLMPSDHLSMLAEFIIL